MSLISKEYSILPDMVESIKEVNDLGQGVWEIVTSGDTHVQTQEWKDRFNPQVRGHLLTYDESGLQVCYTRRGRLTDSKTPAESGPRTGGL